MELGSQLVVFDIVLFVGGRETRDATRGVPRGITSVVPSRWLRECRPSGLRPLLGLNLRGEKPSSFASSTHSATVVSSSSRMRPSASTYLTLQRARNSAAFAIRRYVTEYLAGACGSLRLDAREFHHLAPLLG